MPPHQNVYSRYQLSTWPDYSIDVKRHAQGTPEGKGGQFRSQLRASDPTMKPLRLSDQAYEDLKDIKPGHRKTPYIHKRRYHRNSDRISYQHSHMHGPTGVSVSKHPVEKHIVLCSCGFSTRLSVKAAAKWCRWRHLVKAHSMQPTRMYRVLDKLPLDKLSDRFTT